MSRSQITPTPRFDANRQYSVPLTPKQRRVAELVGRGESWNNAAKLAGYSQGASNVSTWKSDPRILQLISEERRKNELTVAMDRKKVMEGFLEAIEMAKIQSDPTAMIKGWSEIAKMCGYYAPETKKVDISISGKRLVDKFETMSDEELLKYAETDIVDLLQDDSGAYSRVEDV